MRYVRTGAGYVTDPGGGPDQWQVQYEWQEEVGAYVADPGGGPDQWQVTTSGAGGEPPATGLTDESGNQLTDESGTELDDE